MTFTPFYRSIFLTALCALSLAPAFAQNKTDSLPKEDDYITRLINFSRPDGHHQLLGDLAGNWDWKGKQFDDSNHIVREPNGTLTRKSFAHGRFFIVELTSDKTKELLQSPIQDGKMEAATYQTVEIEGYDNVKKKFMKSFINNHASSSIVSYEGEYDSAKHAITYDAKLEVMPGTIWHVHQRLIFINRDQYQTEDYMETDGKWVKGGEVTFTRQKP